MPINNRIIQLQFIALKLEMLGAWYMARLVRGWLEDEIKTLNGRKENEIS